MTEQIYTEPVLVLDDIHGIYIPQIFDRRFLQEGWVSSATELDILPAGPYHPDYWEAWGDVLNGIVTGPDGVEYTLMQDGDLWLIPPGWEWDDDFDWFVPEK